MKMVFFPKYKSILSILITMLICIVGGSKRYLDFLSILGDRIELQDWPLYSGGLDTTGSKSPLYPILQIT